MIERYFDLADFPKRELQRYPAFFEPEPLPGESINSLAQLRALQNEDHVVFTGAIRLGSSVSDKYIGIIRAHFAKMGLAERARRG